MTIKQEQRFLKEQGFYTGNIDGKYGPATKQATKEFQKSQHLEIDGKFGPRTTKCAEVIQAGGYKTKSSWKVGPYNFIYKRKNGTEDHVYISGDSFISTNFQLEEYTMHLDTLKKHKLDVKRHYNVILKERLIIADQKLRTKVGRPMHINSGYRDSAYNKAIGGSKTSEHLNGGASDKVVLGMIPKEVQAVIRKYYKDFGYYGMESKTKPNCNQYTHADVKKRNGDKLVEY